METYPNISKERALESINTVILYIRQFGTQWDTMRYGAKAEEVECFIAESKNKEVKMGKIAELYLKWKEKGDKELDFINCSLEAEAIKKRQLKELEIEIIELIKTCIPEKPDDIKSWHYGFNHCRELMNCCLKKIWG